jgi:hypothetical protein
MSRHVPRRERWAPQGPERYRSVDGLLVYRFKGEWWADVPHALRPDEDAACWERRLDKLGPFRRPRNAMVEAERHATTLRNRHGDLVRFGADLPR